MKRASLDSKIVMAIVKQRSRNLGLTQQQLAKKLGISLPTIKRWLSGEGLTLENLIQILEVLDLSFEEIATTLPRVSQQTFTYSAPQEQFFSENPSFLSYFDQLLQGKTPQTIEKNHGLSKRSTRRYLKELERLGLIEVHPHDKIKLLVIGEPRWRPNGKLSQSLKNQAVQDFLLGFPQLKNVSFALHRYTVADARELESDLKEVLKKAQRFHRRALLTGEKTLAFGLLAALAPFEWRVLKYIPDL